MKKSIVVIGSTNTDMVVSAEHIPLPGETLLGGKFFMNPGGKGANQAVAAVRLGGEVTFICKTGNDLFGKDSLSLFQKEGINISYAISDNENPSGVALIVVSEKGENSIVVAPGANSVLNTKEIENAKSEIESAEILLMQLEIPMDVVKTAARIAKNKNVKVILNPAPACKISNELLGCIDIITPNEREALFLTGIEIIDDESAKEAARLLNQMGVATVIITRGENGSIIFHNNEYKFIPAEKVDVKDTTAAGDVFNGALAVSLMEGKEIQAAVEYASIAAAISVTRYGAQSSAPFKEEVERELVLKQKIKK